MITLIAAMGVATLIPLRSQTQSTQPDNTKVNRRDRSAAEPTADQAKNNMSDRDLMQQIRKSIVSDKSLSTYAHNVKVIAANGKVTLKGPVHSEEEKQTVESKATEIAGAGNVTNQLTVKASKKSTKTEKSS
ncbi:MAG: BON domain-containing protein [Bryobacteraceae bacterium]